MTGRIEWLRYVPHKDVPTLMAAGWEIRDDLGGTNHGHYSVLMIWKGGGDVRSPAEFQCKPAPAAIHDDGGGGGRTPVDPIEDNTK